MQDRIKQMAVEAGLLEPRDEWATVPVDYRTALVSFARLVAEDCATHVERKMTEGRSPMGKVAADAIRARYAETKEG